MLYTTYLSKLNSVPKHITKIIITRTLPKSLDVEKLENTFYIQALSPSLALLKEYKKNNDWDTYVKKFEEEMTNRKDLQSELKHLLNFLKEDEDVVLVCYEKDYEHCHRSLIGKWIQAHGIEWQEYKHESR